MLSPETYFPALSGALILRKLITQYIKQLSGCVCRSCKNDPHSLISRLMGYTLCVKSFIHHQRIERMCTWNEHDKSIYISYSSVS